MRLHPAGEVPSTEDKTYVPSSETSGRLTRLNFGAWWKPNLCRQATGSVGRNFGGRGSTPYVCMHQLSAMFCTAVAATGVVSHVKTSSVIGW